MIHAKSDDTVPRRGDDNMFANWFDMKSAMAFEIGDTLIHWSKNMHSYPGHLTDDEWQAMLYMHGCTLKRYGQGVDYLTNEEEPLYWEPVCFCDEDEVAAIEAKASMQWVTDNFHHLWD